MSEQAKRERERTEAELLSKIQMLEKKFQMEAHERASVSPKEFAGSSIPVQPPTTVMRKSSPQGTVDPHVSSPGINLPMDSVEGKFRISN